MAGDWIKFEKATIDKPEVIAMAASLRLSRHDIVGKLLSIWCWADTISIDGSAVPVPEKFIDELVQKKGFAKALRAVGWMGGEDYKLTFTNFERHNGTTAKARAESNRRVANHRQRNGYAKGVTDVTEEPLQKPLPEKRRVRDNTPLPPFAESGEEDPDLCTLVQAIEHGRMCRMSEAASRFWWNDRKSTGWRKGGPGTARIHSWQHDQANAVSWAEQRAAELAAAGAGGPRRDPAIPRGESCHDIGRI